MGLFLVDKQKSYTYEDLLRKVNGTKSCSSVMQAADLYNFFSNLIVTLISNKPLVLLDSDVTITELKDFEISDVNTFIDISPPNIDGIDLLIHRVLSSNSEITLFTSGTTGQPKKVVHTIQTLTRSTRISDKYLCSIWAFAYNPTHMAGLQVFFQAFANKNKLINIFNTSRKEVYELIDKYHMTHISATPTFYRLLLPVEKSYPEVSRVTLGGEKSDDKLYESIRKIFPNAQINNIYASTEAGSLFAAKGNLFQIPLELRTKIKVEDNELLIHSSLLGKFNNGICNENYYYHSGDLIEWVDEENGLFRFKSRKNELINIGGYKVNPDEIENLILQIEGVQQVIVYGRPNSVLGNILCAEVKIDSGYSLSELDIRFWLANKLQDFKIPRKIKFVDNFLLTRTGKLKRL
jgi:acyl-coenzyme A synthetase/AMP-(fatty) acid ligase